MVKVADVLGRYGPERIQKFRHKKPASRRGTFKDILRCRMPALIAMYSNVITAAGLIIRLTTVVTAVAISAIRVRPRHVSG